MKPIEVKTALFDSIQALTDYKWFFSSRPGKDNTRSRKIPFQKMISSILAFKAGTLNREIMDFYGLDPSIGSASAFIQRRAQILPEAFETLFQHFTSKVDTHKLFRGYNPPFCERHLRGYETIGAFADKMCYTETRDVR